MRTALSAALTRAVREELITRNVARLVELPEWHAGSIRPWTADERAAVPSVSEPDPLHAAFVLLLLYGLRRGEVLGLRWQDVDFREAWNQIRIERQVQRVGGEMHIGPVKTRAGHRNLPLVKLARQALEAQIATQARYRIDMGSAWPDTDLCVHHQDGTADRTAEPRPVVPPDLRSQPSSALIKVHHCGIRSPALLKALGVPSRDAQIILGHSRLAVTLEIYTHTDDEAQLDALTRLHNLLIRPESAPCCYKVSYRQAEMILRIHVLPGQTWRARQDSNPRPAA